MEMLGNGAGMNVGQEFAKTARRRDPEWSPQPLRGSPAIRITPSMCSLGLLGQRALLRRGWSAWQHGFAVRKLQTPGREADCAKIRVAFQSRQHQIECENKKTTRRQPASGSSFGKSAAHRKPPVLEAWCARLAACRAGGIPIGTAQAASISTITERWSNSTLTTRRVVLAWRSTRP